MNSKGILDFRTIGSLSDDLEVNSKNKTNKSSEFSKKNSSRSIEKLEKRLDWSKVYRISPI